MSVKTKAAEGIENLKLYWNHPPHGRYMNFKEIVSLSIGGMGVKFICYAVQLMILSVGNTLIGNTIGIAPKPMYVIYLLSVLAGFPLTALRANIIDSARSKKGKYRPYIFTMAIPTVILAMGFTWMPYDRMSMLWKCVTVLAFNIGFQFFYMLMFDSYTNLINVLSPNTYERSDVCSIKSVTDSFAPTIVGILLPILAKWITGDNTIYDMRIYRAVFPPILLLGLLLTIFIHVNTEEKIVQAKTHVVHIKFMDALKAVAKNKYFWIISLAGWLGFLETAFGTILGWLYNYQEACTDVQYSLVTAVYGNSSLWSMLFAPLLIRKIGKRNILIYSNLMSIVFILSMYPVIAYAPKGMVIWLMLLCMFINGLVTSLGNILSYSLNGDIRDYQQYISGERIEGMFFTVGLIGSVITLATSFVLPAIYDMAGLNETVAKSLGFDGSNVYDVLYNTEYFNRICGVLIIASAIGAVLNVIPFFFYDLTEIKQKAMITVLKIRALFEDYGNNALSDAALVEAIDIIEDAKNREGLVPAKPSKDEIKAAKRMKDKQAVKQAKEAYKAQLKENEEIQIAQYVINEINKFSSPEVIAEVERARLIYDAGLSGLSKVTTISLEEAKAMPKATKEERKIRADAIEKAKNEIESKKVIAKHYPNGLTEFDNSVFEKLFNEEDTIGENLKALYEKLEEAKKEKDKSAMAQIKADIKALKAKKAEIKKEIKVQTDNFSLYNRAARPYLDAKKLLIQKENYAHYEEIKERYEESKERAEKERIAQREAEEREKAEKKAYAAKLKEEKRKAKTAGKK